MVLWPGGYMSFEKYCAELEAKITKSYEEGTTQEQAERLAAEFLVAQFKIAGLLAAADLDSKMRRSGVKAIKAAVYMQKATENEKKPSDVLLNAAVDLHEVVQTEQEAYDRAEAYSDSLERYYNIFRESHIYFRGMAKGTFGV